MILLNTVLLSFNCFAFGSFNLENGSALRLLILNSIPLQAGNILIDSNGAIKLADFGVSACMFDAGDRQRSRNTFVGTPCW